jgi:hypothetical protein
MTIYVVKPSAQQWESLVNEVDHDGRDVGLAGEPRLDRVPIARFNIEQMPRQERSDVRVD